MTGTERALLVGVLGPADRPERLLIKLADGRQEVTARLEEAAARVVAAATRFHPVLPHTPASLTHWVEGGLPIRVTRTHTSADNTGPLSFAGLDTAPPTTQLAPARPGVDRRGHGAFVGGLERTKALSETALTAKRCTFAGAVKTRVWEWFSGADGVQECRKDPRAREGGWPTSEQPCETARADPTGGDFPASYSRA